MLSNGRRDRGAPEVHDGYVAGRYRDGAWSDRWTEVHRCAEGTFVGYAPACRCGWRGAIFPATPDGLMACQRAWVFEHVVRRPEAMPVPLLGASG
jgi:hypothetical protein